MVLSSVIVAKVLFECLHKNTENLNNLVAHARNVGNTALSATIA